MPDDWLTADMNPDDPGSQGYDPKPDVEALRALAIEVRIEERWLAERPEWGHTDLGRRFTLLLNHAKAVLGE
jgi:hypothetical protein